MVGIECPTRERGREVNNKPLYPKVPPCYSQADIDRALEAERKALGKLLRQHPDWQEHLYGSGGFWIPSAVVEALESGKWPGGMK